MMQIIKKRPRKLRKRVLPTPPTSPEKKKAKVIDQSTERTFASSIRTGMKQGKGGLFKFFGKLATEEDNRVTVALWREGGTDTFTQALEAASTLREYILDCDDEFARQMEALLARFGHQTRLDDMKVMRAGETQMTGGQLGFSLGMAKIPYGLTMELRLRLH
jgi:hypothetical protein